MGEIPSTLLSFSELMGKKVSPQTSMEPSVARSSDCRISTVTLVLLQALL